MSIDTLLNRVCNIQTMTETQSPTGQKVQSWSTTLTGVKCRLDPRGGQETIYPSMVFEKATHILFMRNPSTITLDVGQHRVVVDSITYDILLVQKIYKFSDLSHLEVLLQLIE